MSLSGAGTVSWKTVARVGLARSRVELLQFFREKDAVVFIFAFP